MCLLKDIKVREAQMPHETEFSFPTRDLAHYFKEMILTSDIKSQMASATVRN